MVANVKMYEGFEMGVSGCRFLVLTNADANVVPDILVGLISHMLIFLMRHMPR